MKYVLGGSSRICFQNGFDPQLVVPQVLHFDVEVFAELDALSQCHQTRAFELALQELPQAAVWETFQEATRELHALRLAPRRLALPN